jgi:nucleotide-binding universal stress UspA family protein
MIILAYDGSLNGDWVSRYAMRFAAHTESALTVLHVRDGSLGNDRLHVKLQRLEQESRALGVEFVVEILPEGTDVYCTLLEHIPSGPENVVVCGTRVRSRQRRFLSGTVAEKLLRAGLFPVLALRVVQPGLLGAPRDLLLPLMGQPRCFEEVRPFFRMLLPEIDRLFLLRCMQVGAMRLPLLSMARREAMRRAGERYLSGVGEEILHRRDGNTFLLDWRIAICDDCVSEILIQASRLKVHMVLISASERLLGHRLLHDNPLERMLHGAPCDVGIYRSL